MLIANHVNVFPIVLARSRYFTDDYITGQSWRISSETYSWDNRCTVASEAADC